MGNTDKWLGKAVKTLQESESLYRELFESLDEAIQISELIFNDDGKPVDVLILNVNPAYEKHSGLKKDEVIGKPIKNVLSVVEQIWLDRYAEVVGEGKSMHFEEYNEGLDRWFDVHASPLGGNRFAAVFTDITDRKKAEERYREFFTNPIVGFGLCKVVANENGEPVDYIYLEVNDAFEEFTGLKREEIINKGVREVIPEDADNLVSIFGPVGLNGDRIEVEVPIPTLGRIYDVSAYSPSEGHFIAIFTDITKRKKAEEENYRLMSDLDEQRNLLDTIIEQLPVGVGIAEAPSGELIRINEQTRRIWMMDKMEADDMAGYGKYPGFHPDGQQYSSEDWQLVRAVKGEVIHGEELEFIRGDGKHRFMRSNAAPVKDADGNIQAAIVIIEDITKDKKDEESLRENEEKLRTLFETMPIGISILDKDRNIIYENSTLEKILELNKEDLLKGEYAKRKYVNSDMTEISLDELPSAKAFNKQSPVKDIEVGVLKEDNSLIWTNVSAIPLTFPDWKMLIVTSNITKRKKAENVLKESETRFRSVLDNSLDALYRLNLKTSQYEYMSPAFEDVVGYPPNEFISMTAEEAMSIIHPDDLSNAKEALARLANEGHVKVEYRICDSRGKYRWLSNNISLIMDAEGHPLYRDGTIRDITQQKKNEEELRKAHDTLEEKVEERTVELEEAYQSLKESELKAKEQADLLDITHEAIFVRDMNDKIVFWNKGAEELYGWSKKEAQGKITHDILKTQFPEPLEQIKNYVLNKGKWEGELIHERIDGTKIYVLSRWSLQRGRNNRPIGFLEVNADITERKKSENEISQKNKILDGINTIFRATVTNIDEEEFGKTCLAVCEELTGSKISFMGEVNEHGRFDSIAVSNRGWKACSMVKEEGAESVDDNVIRGIRGRAIEERKVLIFNDPTNSPYWSGLPEGHYQVNSFLGAPLIYRDGVIGLIALANKKEGYSKEDIEVMEVITTAITESLMHYRALNQLEENQNELKETINELGRSNKELQSFAYITSHDLQEPLRTMGNYAGLLKHRYQGQLDNDADDFLEYIASGAARMKNMVQGLLDYSRVGTQGGEFSEFNAEVALDSALINLKSAIEECHAEITRDPLPEIVADESQITRVFQNLIGNALKFRKKGVKPEIHISAGNENGEYVFSVQDNGIGIEEEYKDRIFEVFKRLHAIGEYNGVGIGLAVVKRIIERHGGRVWVESEFGEGSTFYFTIPFNK